MKISDIRANAYSMPFVSPSYPIGPYHFVNREFFIITYRTDLDALRQVVPEPLTVKDPLVSFEFIRMPDSSGFGSYTESGQVISVIDMDGKPASYTHMMYLDDESPIAGGRELWGFPKKLANPKLPLNLIPYSARWIMVLFVSQQARWDSNIRSSILLRKSAKWQRPPATCSRLFPMWMASPEFVN